MNDKNHIMEGWRRGHEIEIGTPRNFVNVAEKSFDFAVVSNVAKFPREEVTRIAASGDYAVFHHDFVALCRYRLHFPGIDRCSKKGCESMQVWGPIVENASLNIALSPLHREILQRYHGEDSEWVEVPSAIDPQPFMSVKDREGEDVLAVNPSSYKGKENVMKWANENPDEKVTLLGGDTEEGAGGDGGFPPNCEVKPPAPYSEMPEVYSSHKKVIHLPRTVDPFCRVAVEAVLSGCELVTNKNTGATSYDWFGDREDIATEVQNAPKKFWKEVENAANQA